MSVGNSFISAAARERSRLGFRAVSREWFTEEELPAYEFAVAHITNFGSVPSPETFRENGHRLRGAPEPSAYYANQLRERAMYNSVMDAMPEIRAGLENREMREVLRIIQETANHAALINNTNEIVTLEEAAARVAERFEERQHQHGLVGVETGYPSLNEATGGWLPGDVIVIVGRPNVGKSYKLFKSIQMANVSGYSALIVSMEMGTDQCATRFVGLGSGLNPKNIREGHVGTRGRTVLYNTIDGIGNLPPVHLMAGNFRKNVQDIDTLVQELNPDIIGIDAGYLLSPSRDRKRSGRREYIADVIEEIKGSAVARNKPFLITVQFNREQKKGSTKEMDVSQIAETDAIGQIASGVVGMRHGKGAFIFSRRECSLIKNREGELCSYSMNYRFNPMMFDEIAVGDRVRWATPQDYDTQPDEEDEAEGQELAGAEL